MVARGSAAIDLLIFIPLPTVYLKAENRRNALGVRRTRLTIAHG
jgi:hypothetical protein